MNISKENDHHQKLRTLALNVSNNAYSPYSKAKVGAAIVCSNGMIYSGCNVENASYGGTICAERVAIVKAVSESNDKIQIEKLYIYTDAGWPPCGMCRQVIAEFASDELIVIIGDKNKKEQIISFKELFPHQFSSKHLKD